MLRDELGPGCNQGSTAGYSQLEAGIADNLPKADFAKVLPDPADFVTPPLISTALWDHKFVRSMKAAEKLAERMRAAEKSPVPAIIVDYETFGYQHAGEPPNARLSWGLFGIPEFRDGKPTGHGRLYAVDFLALTRESKKSDRNDSRDNGNAKPANPLEPFREIFENDKILKIIQWIKFERDQNLDYNIPIVNGIDISANTALLRPDLKVRTLAAQNIEFCGASMSKELQDSDWEKRPLGPGQLEYMIRDVQQPWAIYLEQRKLLEQARINPHCSRAEMMKELIKTRAEQVKLLCSPHEGPLGNLGNIIGVLNARIARRIDLLRNMAVKETNRHNKRFLFSDSDFGIVRFNWPRRLVHKHLREFFTLDEITSLQELKASKKLVEGGLRAAKMKDRRIIISEEMRRIFPISEFSAKAQGRVEVNWDLLFQNSSSNRSPAGPSEDWKRSSAAVNKLSAALAKNSNVVMMLAMSEDGSNNIEFAVSSSANPNGGTIFCFDLSDAPKITRLRKLLDKSRANFIFASAQERRAIERVLKLPKQCPPDQSSDLDSLAKTFRPELPQHSLTVLSRAILGSEMSCSSSGAKASCCFRLFDKLNLMSNLRLAVDDEAGLDSIASAARLLSGCIDDMRARLGLLRANSLGNRLGVLALKDKSLREAIIASLNQERGSRVKELSHQLNSAIADARRCRSNENLEQVRSLWLQRKEAQIASIKSNIFDAPAQAGKEQYLGRVSSWFRAIKGIDREYLMTAYPQIAQAALRTVTPALNVARALQQQGMTPKQRRAALKRIFCPDRSGKRKPSVDVKPRYRKIYEPPGEAG